MLLKGTNLSMKWNYAVPLLTLFGIFIVSCQIPVPRGSQIRAEWPQIVERARARVLEELPNLDEASLVMIRADDPKLRIISLPFASDYTYIWTISSNRTVELSAYSDFRTVAGKPVKIREAAPDRH